MPAGAEFVDWIFRVIVVNAVHLVNPAGSDVRSGYSVTVFGGEIYFYCLLGFGQTVIFVGPALNIIIFIK